MNFLPKNYEGVPSISNYMKLQEGANQFRILSSAIVGWEVWVVEQDGNKPKRQREQFDVLPENTKKDKDGNYEKPKHFWAFVVYDRSDDAIKILELTQSGIQKAMRAFVDDPDWGDPKEYDIVITGEGEGLERRYQVNPKPKQPIDLTEDQAARVATINLEALYDGEDPFADESIDTEEVAKKV